MHEQVAGHELFPPNDHSITYFLWGEEIVDIIEELYK